MNKVFLIGRLTRDPELRYSSDLAVARTAIAVDKWKDGADFFNVVAFSKTAEHMEKYWKKGMKAAIVGRLENNTFKAKDGTQKTETRIVIEDIEFCESKGEKKESPKEWAEPDEGETLPFNFG